MLKDHYKKGESYFCEPCNTCDHRFKNGKEYPCNECVHNETAIEREDVEEHKQEEHQCLREKN
jgi:hypothetical protein